MLLQYDVYGVHFVILTIICLIEFRVIREYGMVVETILKAIRNLLMIGIDKLLLRNGSIVYNYICSYQFKNLCLNSITYLFVFIANLL